MLDRAILTYTEADRWALWLSLPLAVLLAVASAGGLLIPSTYAKETRIIAAQNAGGDAMNLIVIVPVLLVSALLALRGSPRARLAWTSTLVYLLYDFIYYTFAVPFNSMFLAYCGVLGLSFYAVAGSLRALPVAEIANRYGPRAPVKTTAIVLLAMAFAMVFHWLYETVPALLAGRVPQAVRESGLVTEPVAVLDLAFMAPACMIAAILLLRRKPLGFVLGPVFLTVLVLSSLGLVSMGAVMALRGFATGNALFAIGLGIAASSSVLLALSLREGKAVQQQR